jgi:hypothetical protein
MGSPKSYSVLRETVLVEEVIKAYAAGAGLDASALMREWTGYSESGQTKPVPPARRAPRDRMDDDLPMPGDEDDNDSPPEEESPTKACPQCRGLGRDKSGAKCSMCGGSGRISSVIDEDDDDGDDDDNEKESCWYEYEEE